MPQIERYAGIIISPASENQKRPKAENAVPAKRNDH
jgi:hypothetical protein